MIYSFDTIWYSLLHECVYACEIIYVNIHSSFKCQVSYNFLGGSLDVEIFYNTLICAKNVVYLIRQQEQSKENLWAHLSFHSFW